MSQPIEPKSFVSYASAKKLVVLLHAYTHTPDSLSHVKAVVADCHQVSGADFFIPDLPLSTMSCADPVALCNQLLEQIDALWAVRIEKYGTPYEGIIIVGHSVGALLGRKLYIYACGEIAKAPFEPGIRQKCHPSMGPVRSSGLFCWRA